jgi:hypothetical protein
MNLYVIFQLMVKILVDQFPELRSRWLHVKLSFNIKLTKHWMEVYFVETNEALDPTGFRKMPYHDN